MELVVDKKPEEMGRVFQFSHEVNKSNKYKDCNHQRFVVDVNHGSVECADCEEVVSAFHALKTACSEEGLYQRRLEAMRIEYKQLQAYQPWLKAVKTLESIWRGKMLPCCPYCKKGIEAEELARSGMISRRWND